MNKAILAGYIGKDPEVFTFDNGDKKTTFTVATKESYKDKSGEWKETTDWHNVVLFRETKMQKGDLVTVEGKIKTRSYDDKDGNKRYLTEVVAQRVSLLHRKQENHAASPEHTEPDSPTSPALKEAESLLKENGFETVSEDDLPF